MHQPIHWHEWGEDAFAAARRENKPMLLDIGAVWCHWCHVMDRESYDDAEVAKIINENFIAVKVDRDERPDIDSRYQAAVGALTGQGGWPLTAFLTSDGKPFYGGTYFPPHELYGRPSFKRVLTSIANAYREKHGDVVEQAALVEQAIAKAESSNSSASVSPDVIDAIASAAIRMFDDQNGGFGTAPKFPHPSTLDLLIHQQSVTGNDELRDVVVTTLEKMARGGVYDQLAGGFHRYSVDEHWIVPHFEKMSYDNSELLKNYLHAYQATGNEFFSKIARDIIRWVDEWLSDRAHGGFYASQDADYSMEDDGDYFTWTLEEAKAALTEDEAAVACLHYDIGEIGEMHHNPQKNVLYIRADVPEISRRLNLPEDRVRELLASAKKKMYAARLTRPTPYVDKTVYTAWNAMFVSAYLRAASVLNLLDDDLPELDLPKDELPEVRRFALRSLDRLLAEGWQAHSPSASASNSASPAASARSTHTLRHVIAYSDPHAERRETEGVLDDYAFTVIACLDAYEATADLSYFRFARQIADAMIAGFYDTVNGGFFDTPVAASKSSEQSPGTSTKATKDDSTQRALGILGTRRKPFQDSPTPAGNSAAAIALLRLHAYTHEPSYREQAEQTLKLYAASAAQHGIFASTYGLAVARFTQPHTQVVVVLGNDDFAHNLYRAAQRSVSLNTALIQLDAAKAVPQNLPPSLAETIPQLPALTAGRSFAVVCSASACQPPVFHAEDLSRLLAAQTRPAA